MKLTYAGLKDRDAFLNASIALPSYDPEKLAETTSKSNVSTQVMPEVMSPAAIRSSAMEPMKMRKILPMPK